SSNGNSGSKGCSETRPQINLHAGSQCPALVGMSSPAHRQKGHAKTQLAEIVEEEQDKRESTPSRKGVTTSTWCSYSSLALISVDFFRCSGKLQAFYRHCALSSSRSILFRVLLI